METTAELSSCRNYRYALWRRWDNSKPLAMIIGLNPSTADEVSNDPTLIRCINFAKSWGYGGVCMANLFAYRATKPKVMKLQTDPIGISNDKWLAKLASESDIVIAAWGNHGSFKKRSTFVVDMLPNLYYLQMNKSGQPAHPLYLKADLIPVPMGIKKQ
jgi:hypothetical protein